MAKQEGLCDQSDVEALQKIVSEKLDWVDQNLELYEQALPGGGGGSNNTVLIVVLVLIFGAIILVAAICFIRWKRNKQSE